MQKFAHIVSNIFQPLLIPTYGLILLFQAGMFAYTDIHYKVYTIFTIFVLTAIVPLISLLVLKKLGVISSILLAERKERTVPYLFAIFTYITAIIFLWRIFMPMYIVSMMSGCLLAIIAVMLINLKWKISAHLCAMGSLCAAILVVSLRLGISSPVTLSLAFIISGLVSSARLILKVHTAMQTVAGFLLGFIFVAVSGLINVF